MTSDFIAGVVLGAFGVSSLVVSFFAWACCAVAKRSDEQCEHLTRIEP